jgi:hypothetical protein
MATFKVIVPLTNRSGTVSNVTTKSKVTTATTLDNLNGVDTSGAEDGYTLVYDAATGNWEAAPASELATTVQRLDGGTY